MFMRTLWWTVAICAAMPLSVAAQESNPSNPLTGGEKGIYSMVSRSVIGAAEKMPESDYAFKPTPEVRSFGQLVGHVADAQYSFCSAALGETSPVKGIEKSKTSKAELVQSLKDAVAYCGKAYEMTDAQASQVVRMFGHDMPKLAILTFNSAHTDEHYGNMVTYLRLKGIVPPTSEGKK